MAAGIRAVMTGQKTEFHLEYPCHSPQQQRWFIGRATRFTGAGPVRVVMAHENITERKQAETELRQFSLAVGQSPVSVVITNLQGDIEYVNPKFCAVTGYSFAEVYGKNSRVLKSGEMPEELYRQMWAAISAGEEWHGEIHNRKKNGELYWEDASIAPVRDVHGKITHFIAIKEDVTARKRAVQELAESRQFLDRIINTVGDPIFVKDRQHGLVVVNDALCALVGRERQELLGRTDRDFFPKAEVDVFWARDEQMFNTGVESIHEETVTDAAGNTHTILTRKNVHRNEHGELFLVGVIHDITDRKHFEELLRQSEARFRSYFELGVTGMAVTSPAKGCLEVNDQLCQVLGYARAELLRMSWADVTHPEDLAAEAPLFNRLLTGECDSYALDKRFVRKDGRIVYATISVKCVRRADGSVDYVVAVLQDITERKLAETALRESEEKFRQLADNITDVFWMTSPDLNSMHYISAGYELVWGRSCESLLAHPHQWIEAVLPEDRAQVAAVFATLMANAPAVSVEYQIARPDGTVRWIHDRGFQVRDAAGHLIRLAGIASDITDRKLAARQLAEHKENEERALRELEREHALNEIKSRFVSLVSHEFRTPLCIIKMAAALLDTYSGGMSPEERSGQVREIQIAVGRMTGMMEDFLVHEKIQCGKMECRPARVNLQAFCTDLISELLPALGATRVVECTVDPAVREAVLDGKILRHILGNLLSNAVKYSNDGQRVLLEARRVTGCTPTPDDPEPLRPPGSPIQRAKTGRLQPPGDSGQPPEDHLQLMVRDEGIGIPEADRAKLFQSFHRAVNVGNRPGTGMGLAIVKQFVELHRGAIRVESQEGTGTTVWVWLPLRPPVAAGVPPAVAGGILPPGPAPAVTHDPQNGKNLCPKS
jgi:PAS domain S-box-containing protein